MDIKRDVFEFKGSLNKQEDKNINDESKIEWFNINLCTIKLIFIK